MFTQEEKKMLLDLLNSVTVSGNRRTIPQTLEKLDTLARKIEAIEVMEAETTPALRAGASVNRMEEKLSVRKRKN